MKNQCRDVMQKIKVPNSLKDKVLDAACTVQPGIAEITRRRPKHHRVLRAAVCAALTFAVLLGGLSFFKPDSGKISATKGVASGLPPAYNFGLVAYAADMNKTFVPKDNKIAFSIANSGGGEVPGKGDYTGCLFRVTGDGIKTLSFKIDRGGLYRYKRLTNLTKNDIKAIYASEANGTLKADCQFAGSRDGKTWYSDQMTALGGSFSENWSADASYGFWVPPKSIRHSESEDLRESAHKSIDTFNGATLTITVTFQNGTRQTKALHLKTGKLKVADNNARVLPELASNNDPYIYSVYASLED